MPEDSETKYKFSIGTRNMDFISRYLNGLKLKEGKDYDCLRNLGIINASLTVEQAEGLREDMKDYLVEIQFLDDEEIQLLGNAGASIRKRFEEIVSRQSKPL